MGRTIAVAFLLAGLLAQTQVVFACELLNAKQLTVCCCGAQMTDGCTGGAGCELTATNPAVNCCDVSISVSAGISAVGPITSSHTTVPLDASQPLLAMLTAQFMSIDPSRDTCSILDRHTLPVWLAGTDTYLHTNRFRL